jgi:apolipoprotein N-acyltransferase
MIPLLSRLSRSTFAQALAGAALLWAALPPWDLGPLAFVAPLAWVMLVRREELPGRRPYLALYGVGFLFWLAALHWLRLPHPATALGWFGVAIYFGCYLPLFVGLTRVAVHRLRVPVVLAAPVVWTGLELARGHLLTGMTMASLGHTQHGWITLIQISDLAGAYGVGFLVMLATACLARMLPVEGKPWAAWPLLPAGVAMAATLAYGLWRTSVEPTEPRLRVALIQGSIDTVLDPEPGVYNEVWRQYAGLSREAVKRYPNLDLLVWPESTFPDYLITYTPDAQPPPDLQCSEAEFHERLALAADATQQSLARLARDLDVHLLLGIPTHHYGQERVRRFNSAAFVAPDGRVLARYDKTHLVLFGEYVPFADWLPWIAPLTPLPVSLNEGAGPVGFELNGVRIAPNICYESVLPHVIRRQVLELRARGEEPDVLVNLTNDGWFWGSSELDMHLICGVFRAVECRKPLLIAANTGFSAWIDGDGRVLKKGPRQDTGTILAEVRLDRRGSFYLRYGDWPAGLCLLGCGVAGVVGLWGRLRRVQAGS